MVVSCVVSDPGQWCLAANGSIIRVMPPDRTQARIATPQELYGGVLTLDGASGTGKSAAIQRLRERWPVPVLESGVIIRTVAWEARNRGTSIGSACERLDRVWRLGALGWRPAGDDALAAIEPVLDGVRIGHGLFDRSLDANVASASTDPMVLQWVASVLRWYAAGRLVIVSGREAGSVFLPEAGTKVVLTAESDLRAQRKYGQFRRAGHRELLGPIREEVLWRPDPAAFHLDSSDALPIDLAREIADIWQHRLDARSARMADRDCFNSSVLPTM